MGGKKKGGSGKSTGSFGSPTGSPGEKIEGSSAPVNAAISVAPRTTTTAVEDIAPAAVADAKGDADAKADADAEASFMAMMNGISPEMVQANNDAEAKATADIEATAKTAEAKHVAAAYAAALKSQSSPRCCAPAARRARGRRGEGGDGAPCLG